MWRVSSDVFRSSAILLTEVESVQSIYPSGVTPWAVERVLRSASAGKQRRSRRSRSTGIRVRGGATGVQISKSRFTNLGTGIAIEEGSEVTIRDSIFESVETGIDIRDSRVDARDVEFR